VFVFTSQDLTLSFPPIFQMFIPGSTRAVTPHAWTQTPQQWRLQLRASSNKSVDDHNYIGLAKTARDAVTLRALKPPMAPTQDVSVGIEQTINGQTMSLAQALSEKGSRQEWKVDVASKTAGPVTITWPNLASIPKNIRVRLVDVASSTSRDLRAASGYSYTAAKDSTRQFLIQTEPGGQVAPVIGNVVVGATNRSPGSPILINYTLSTTATTSVRILSGSGREVFAVTRGRSDNVGENSAVWNLKDNSNRAVAPGTYRVEIVAETTNGDRVRKIVPVNVIR
jgi:hypothetical protein